jgi:RNA polymerase subunit RPABC4/transcription elongation factor Spt4
LPTACDWCHGQRSENDEVCPRCGHKHE